MTTTYELYTNENGTPKAVEGKAPAIVERVEALEADVESLEEKSDDYLPLRGGTMVGKIVSSSQGTFGGSDDTLRLHFSGGRTYETGAYLILSGKDTEIDKGEFYLGANNGTSKSELQGKPDGTLTWDGDNVITSAGGRFTGNVTFPFGSVTNGNNEILFSGSPDPSLESQFPVLALRNGNHGNPYSFLLCSRNSKGGNYLEGKIDGTLYWNGKGVICVESWRSGANWYRKYSDGWIEQGGTITAKEWGVVTFHTPFANDVLYANAKGYSGTANNYEDFKIYDRPSTTNMYLIGIYTTPSANGQMSITGTWYACGY